MQWRLAVTIPHSLQRLQGWIASHRKITISLVVVLVVLPLAVFVPVRITVNITFVGEHMIQIVIDDEVVGTYDLPWPYQDAYMGHTHKSYSVGVGQHTVMVINDGMTDFQQTVIAWPLVGCSVLYEPHNPLV